jgi:DNA-binding MarR family transcriptional regulator
MDAIVKIDKPTPSAIAKSILLSQATVTNLIDRLEKKRTRPAKATWHR